MHLQVDENDAVQEEGAIFGASLNQHFTEGLWIIDHFSWVEVEKSVQDLARDSHLTIPSLFFSWS